MHHNLRNLQHLPTVKTSVFMRIPTPSTKHLLLIGIPSTNCRGPITNPRRTICTIGIPRKVKGIHEQLLLIKLSPSEFRVTPYDRLYYSKVKPSQYTRGTRSFLTKYHIPLDL